MAHHVCWATASPTDVISRLWSGNDHHTLRYPPSISWISETRASRTSFVVRIGKSKILRVARHFPVRAAAATPAALAVSCRAGGYGAEKALALETNVEKDEVPRLPISVDRITSPSNVYIKYLVRLRQSAKVRSTTSSILVVGVIPLREICESLPHVPTESEAWNSSPKPRLTVHIIDVLLMREDAPIPAELAARARRIVRVSSSAMSRLSGVDSPPEGAGVLAFPSTFASFNNESPSGGGESKNAEMQLQNWCAAAFSSSFASSFSISSSSSRGRILVLDFIQDPGNLGTLLRTAAAFGWDGVFLLRGCCDPFNEKALRAARGAAFRMPIAMGDWRHVKELAFIHKMKLYAGDPDANPPSISGRGLGPHHDLSESWGSGSTLTSMSLTGGEEGPLCLVLGSEGQGLREEVRRDCLPVGIPMPGKFDSLNVAVAGGILMFLLRRIE